MTKRILYIEDNTDNIVLIQRALLARGYELISAKSGATGLERANADHPDLILLDINLPDIDGYEVARRLRGTPEFVQTPILAITANALKGDADKALAAGCDAHLAKPINLRELWSHIEVWLPDD